LVGDAALTQMEGQMSTTKTETLAGIEQGIHGIAATQKSHGGLLNIIAKRQEEIIKLLTPELKDGPTFDELIGTMIDQLSELIGYARQNVKMQAQLEQNLPGDIMRALATAAEAAPATNGARRGGGKA